MTPDEATPTKLQALVDRYRRGDLNRDDYLEHLRHDYHSVHARVRSEALSLLDVLPEPERTRELIWFATECQWRETRVDIVRALVGWHHCKGASNSSSIWRQTMPISACAAKRQRLWDAHRLRSPHATWPRATGADHRPSNPTSPTPWASF